MSLGKKGRDFKNKLSNKLLRNNGASIVSRTSTEEFRKNYDKINWGDDDGRNKNNR